MRIGSRLGMTLLLFGAGAVVLHMAPPVKGAVNPAWLFGLPTTLSVWSGAEGVPEEILPPDPSEKVSMRRTYRNGMHIAWVSVALFAGETDDAHRPSVNKIYPQHNASLIEPVSFSASLSGPAANPVGLPAVIVHRDSQRLVVVYWHQIGRQTYGGEYGFRLALIREILLARRADSLLARIAVPADDPIAIREALETVSTLAPLLYSALNDTIAVRATGNP